MPTLNYRVEATGINVLEPVTEEVVTGLLEELDLTRHFTNAVFIKSSFQANSNYSDGEGSINLTSNRCDVMANFIMDKSQVPWPVDSPHTTAAMGVRNSQRGTYTPVLADPKAGVLIEHQTVACAIKLDFNLKFMTFDEATKAFDSLQNRYKGGLIQQPFHLAFSYPVSYEMMKLLIQIFEAKADYKNKKFMDWIHDTMKTEISWDVRKSQLNKEDADKQLLIRIQQLNCILQLTMDQLEPDVGLIEQAPGTYGISFTTTIQFGRPSMIKITTPISIDNTPLPEELFSSINQETHYSGAVSGVYSDLTCNEFMRRSYGNFNAAHQLVRIPNYDDWLTFDQTYLFYQYRPFLVAHFTLDGPETVIDLKDLGSLSIHPVVKAIMKETGESIFRFGGLFHIGVFADQLKLHDDLLSIDEDLKLTIRSNRKDKVYHLVLSETTELFRTDPIWDKILIKYRYFFPMTIERNLQKLIEKNVFYVGYHDNFLNLISKLSRQGKIKALLGTMVALGEVTNEIYAYTQNPSQLADFLVYTQSKRDDYALPTGTSEASLRVREYYEKHASVTSRSLFVAFMEVCLTLGYITLSEIPTQYLDPSRTMYPYYSGQGGFYGFNTPVRVFNITIDT